MPPFMPGIQIWRNDSTIFTGGMVARKWSEQAYDEVSFGV